MNETDRKIDEGTRKGRAERHSRGSVEYFQRKIRQFLAQKSVKFKRLGYNRVVITRGVDFHSVVTFPTVDVSELP